MIKSSYLPSYLPSYLTGQLLLAMPGMTDPRFDRSVIYICRHSEEGAMGLVINSAATGIDFPNLLDQLDVKYDPKKMAEKKALGDEINLYAGGPVEPGRGFILHSVDFKQASTLVISETVALTARVDILAAISAGKGPKNFIVALGYTGWGNGQLEQEIKRNSWLNVDADDALLFCPDLDLKWPRAMAKLGIDIAMLSKFSGNA